MSTEARPLIERCLAKTPRGGPPPTACSPRWAPSSRRRTGCLNRSSARLPGIPLHVPRPPRLLRPLRRSGRLRRSGSSASQRHRPRRPAPQRRYRAGKACSWRPQAISRPAPRGACRRLRIHILPGRSINSPRQAGGTGRGASRGGRCWNHWRRYRGSRHSQYRGDRFHRAFAYSNSVPGGTDVLSGGILARDAGPRPVWLRVRSASRQLSSPSSANATSSSSQGSSTPASTHASKPTSTGTAAYAALRSADAGTRRSPSSYWQRRRPAGPSAGPPGQLGIAVAAARFLAAPRPGHARNDVGGDPGAGRARAVSGDRRQSVGILIIPEGDHPHKSGSTPASATGFSQRPGWRDPR